MPDSRNLELLDAALDCIFVMDAAGGIVALNASAERTFGYRREDVVGRPLAEVIVPPAFRERHRAGLARFVATGQSSMLGKRLELRAMRADESEFPAEVTITRGRLGDRTVFVGFVRDITERHALADHREMALREISRAASRLRQIQVSTAELAAARTVQDIGDAVLRVGVEMLGAATGAFVRPIDDRSLGIVSSVGVPDAVKDAFLEIPRGASTPTVEAFRTGQEIWLEDDASFHRRYSTMGAALQLATSAVAALPLHGHREVLAAIGFRFDRPRTFDEAERSLLRTFVSQAAQSLERVLAHERAITARQRLEALAGLIVELAQTLSEDEVARVVIEHGMSSFSADTCTLYRLDPTGRSLTLVAERGCSPDLLDRIRKLDLGSGGPIAVTVATGEWMWAETEAEYAALFPALASSAAGGPRAKAFWCGPLVVEGRTIGLLAMGFYAPRSFSSEDRVFIRTCAQSSAQAMRRAQRLESESLARRRLSTTLRSIGDAVIATDGRGDITFMNPVAEALTGWSEAEAQGKAVDAVFRIVNEHTRDHVESPVHHVLREGNIVGLANHTLLLAKDGREIPIDDSGAPIKTEDGAVGGVVLVFRDVTLKKRDEHRRLFLTQAAEALGSSLDYEATLATIARLAVPVLADWCGVDIAEPGGRSRQVAVAHIDPSKVEMARELGVRYPPDPSAKTGAPNVLRTGVSELYPEIPQDLLEASAVDAEHLRIVRALTLRSAMVVPMISRGAVLGVISFLYAESDRRYTADDLEFAEGLARQAAAAIDNSRLYTSEQQARRAADVANGAKDEFLATVSHELRTPLNAVMGWARMLPMIAEDPARVARATDTIERNSVAMARLIEDLLDVSRITSGKMRLDVQSVDVARVVEAAVESARPAADAKDITLRAVLDHSAGALMGDPTRLQQIVWNLLSNAVKFTPNGGRVLVALRRSASAIEISVGDSGPGIDPEFLPYVFDPFRQADGKATRKHGGLGLGLAIVRQLVELHGGHVEAQSEGPGKGAVFLVRLPLSATARAETQRTSAAGSVLGGDFDAPAPLSGVRVLVVDDDDDARLLVRTVLEQCGVLVRTADSVTSAMALFAEEAPDLLLSDIGMPLEDGYEMIRRVRALPAARGGAVPAVALTAYTRAEERRRVLAAGYTMHLAKPVEPAELVAALANLARLLPGRSPVT